MRTFFTVGLTGMLALGMTGVAIARKMHRNRKGRIRHAMRSTAYVD